MGYSLNKSTKPEKLFCANKKLKQSTLFIIFTNLVFFTMLLGKPGIIEGQGVADSNIDLLILPTERFSGPVQQAGCMSDSGARGCYIALIQTPLGITVNYSEKMLSELSSSVRSLTSIENREYSSANSDDSYMVYSVIIPSDSGGSLDIEEEIKGVPSISHLFPPDESGQILYYELRKSGIRVEDDELGAKRLRATPEGVVLEGRGRRAEEGGQEGWNREDTGEIEENDVLAGRLALHADVDAEILINSVRLGIGNVNLVLDPGIYQIEMVHQLGREKFEIEVSADEFAQRFITFLPNRSTAMQLSLFFPGGGQIYTKQYRGYFYLLGSLASAAYATYSVVKYRSHDTDHQNAVINYQNANTVVAASIYRDHIESSFQSMLSARERAYIGAGIFGAIYLIQLADVAFIDPPFGYRSQSGNNFSAGIKNGGFSLKYQF